jgi:DNA-binding MarR family transcriptional regulator
MIDRLEKAGLVSRGTDADDARVKMVCLTESGMDMIRQSEAQWIEELSGPFDHFSDQEREQLVDLISRLHAYMRESG